MNIEHGISNAEVEKVQHSTFNILDSLSHIHLPLPALKLREGTGWVAWGDQWNLTPVSTQENDCITRWTFQIPPPQDTIHRAEFLSRELLHLLAAQKVDRFQIKLFIVPIIMSPATAEQGKSETQRKLMVSDLQKN
jgi:hypothetical protein